MEVEGDRIVTKEKAIEVLQKERDLIAGERELDESQFATELLEALNVGIDAIMEQIGVTIHINIRDADEEEVMKMFDKYGLIERILYGKKTEEKGSVTCVNQEKMHDKTSDDIISRRALLKQIAIDSSGSEGYYGDEWKFIETIKNMPSAQPELIRCKDCKWYGRADKRRFYRGMDFLQKRINTIVPDKDFCSRAERRTDE